MILESGDCVLSEGYLNNIYRFVILEGATWTPMCQISQMVWLHLTPTDPKQFQINALTKEMRTSLVSDSYIILCVLPYRR